jgi:hypothetical protein
MLFRHRLAGCAHVEKHTPIFQHSRCRMINQIFFNVLRKFARGRRTFTGGHRHCYQPCRARRLVICAVWWRECQS